MVAIGVSVGDGVFVLATVGVSTPDLVAVAVIVCVGRTILAASFGVFLHEGIKKFSTGGSQNLLNKIAAAMTKSVITAKTAFIKEPRVKILPLEAC